MALNPKLHRNSGLEGKNQIHGLSSEMHLAVARTLTTVYVHLWSPNDPLRRNLGTSEVFTTACQILRLKQEEADSLFLWPTADRIASSSCWHTLLKKVLKRLTHSVLKKLFIWWWRPPHRNMTLVKDLLPQSPGEKRKNKKQHLVQSPPSYFMDMKEPRMLQNHHRL